jgi:hypothetical protein
VEAAARAFVEKTAAVTDVSPHFLLRVAGLPFECVEGLRLERATQWASTVLDLEESLAALRDPVVGGLHSAINGTEDRPLRLKLLNLKRDVFNLRPASNSTDLTLLLEALQDTERGLLLRWVRLSERLRQALADGPAIIDAEIAEKRTELRRVVQDSDLRKGILLASRQLDRAAESYLASDSLKLSRRQRLAERSLLEYLYRTACKTSPFSTFTAVAFGEFRDDPETVADVDFAIESMAKRSFVRLNVSLLSKLSACLAAHADVRRDLLVQLPPGWQLMGDRLRYLRRSERKIESAQAIVTPIRENVLKLPGGQVLQDLLNFMTDGRKIPLGELVTRLTTIAYDTRTEWDVEEYLLHVLRLGLLVMPDLRLDIHSPDPLRDYRQRLASHSNSIVVSLAEQLYRVEEIVDRYESASLIERREGLQVIENELRACFSIVGAEGASVGSGVIYEDTTLTPRELSISKPVWRDVLTSLAELQELLPIFDFNLPRRLVTKGFFHARFDRGAHCDDFLRFAEEFNHDFFEQYLKRSMRRRIRDEAGRLLGHENTFKMPEIDALNRARQAFADYMTEAFSDLRGDEGELVLQPARLREISGALPPDLEPLQTHAFFCQLGREGGQPLLTLNRVYAGFGLLFSRFAHFLSGGQHRDLATELRSALASLQPKGAIFAELPGGYDATNLNLHPPVTHYEIVCPGDASTRPADEQITLDDLFLQHSTDDDMVRLYSKRLRRQVIPVYLGFLLPMALPQIQQVLLNFSYVSLCPLSVWTGVEARSAEDGVAKYPRVRFRNLVLERAMWKMRPQLLPQRGLQQSDGEHFLEFARWRRRNGISSPVFVTPDDRMARDGRGPFDRDAYKPVYVDFDDIFSLSLLDRTARAAGDRLVMKEMLPHRDQLWLRQGGHSYVTEFVIEMNHWSGVDD